jgi:hypothetical protein
MNSWVSPRCAPMRISRPGSGARELLFILPARFKAELVILGFVSEQNALFLRPPSCLSKSVYSATCNKSSNRWWMEASGLPSYGYSALAAFAKRFSAQWRSTKPRRPWVEIRLDGKRSRRGCLRLAVWLASAEGGLASESERSYLPCERSVRQHSDATRSKATEQRRGGKRWTPEALATGSISAAPERSYGVTRARVCARAARMLHLRTVLLARSENVNRINGRIRNRKAKSARWRFHTFRSRTPARLLGPLLRPVLDAGFSPDASGSASLMASKVADGG